MLKRSKKQVSVLDQYIKKDINLLPDLYFKKKKRLRYAFLLLFVIALGTAGFTYQIYRLNVELAETKADNQAVLISIEEKKEERDRQLLLTALKNRIEYKVDLLKQIEQENASVVQISNAIESALPSGVLYVNVDFDSTEHMTVYGQTQTESEIPDLIYKLRSMNLFSTVAIDTITRTETENYAGVDIFYEFVLTCEFGGEQNAAD